MCIDVLIRQVLALIIISGYVALLPGTVISSYTAR